MPINYKGDISLWHLWHNDFGKRLNLDNIRHTDKKYFLRLWMNRRIVEIWTDSAKIFYELLQPSQAEIRKVKSISQMSGIRNIPSEDSIKNWPIGSDGYSIEFEFADQQNYSFKTYWEPKYQDSLYEAKRINSYVDSL